MADPFSEIQRLIAERDQAIAERDRMALTAQALAEQNIDLKRERAQLEVALQAKLGPLPAQMSELGAKARQMLDLACELVRMVPVEHRDNVEAVEVRP